MNDGMLLTCTMILCSAINTAIGTAADNNWCRGFGVAYGIVAAIIALANVASVKQERRT